MPEVGDKAPDFNLLDQNQARVELKKILSKGKVLLVFYPGNNTPG
jgi:peroxiredoxin